MVVEETATDVAVVPVFATVNAVAVDPPGASAEEIEPGSAALCEPLTVIQVVPAVIVAPFTGAELLKRA